MAKIAKNLWVVLIAKKGIQLALICVIIKKIKMETTQVTWRFFINVYHMII